MTFSVALVGIDGAGKSTVARRLVEQTASPIRYRSLYMGQSLRSGAALPTSRIASRLLAPRSGRVPADSERSDPVRTAASRPRTRRRGRIRLSLGLANRFVEAWWRQLVSAVYRRRGSVVVYDRHFLFESAMELGSAREPERPFRRLEHWLFTHAYPRPDLVVFLDASPDVALGRKREFTERRIRAWRLALVEQGARTPNFLTIDADRPVEDVVADVRDAIEAFHAHVASGRVDTRRAARSTGRPTGAAGGRAIVVGLDHLNGVQTARLLARRGVRVIGVANDPRHYGCRTRVCERIEIAGGDDDALVETLEVLARDLDGPAVLFPCTDAHVLAISRNRDRLEPSYRVVLPPSDVVEMMLDKVRFYTWAKDNALPLPPTRFLRDRSDAELAAAELAFPCVLKPPTSGLPAWERHSKLKAYVLRSPEELLDAYDRLAGLAPILIAQEWIPGPITDLYSCNAYFDVGSQPLATFVARKIRQWPPETGESCLGEECRNDEVLEETIRLFKTAGLSGLGYLEMKRHARTGEHLIVEPNIGRPTGRSPIAEAGGVELLLTMYREALGLPLPEAREQRYGTAKWIHLRRDTQSALHAWRRGELTPLGWWRSIRGPKTDALFSWRDPGPFVADLARAARLFLSPEERRRRDYARPFS